MISSINVTKSAVFVPRKCKFSVSSILFYTSFRKQFLKFVNHRFFMHFTDTSLAVYYILLCKRLTKEGLEICTEGKFFKMSIYFSHAQNIQVFSDRLLSSCGAVPCGGGDIWFLVIFHQWWRNFNFLGGDGGSALVLYAIISCCFEIFSIFSFYKI